MKVDDLTKTIVREYVCPILLQQGCRAYSPGSGQSTRFNDVEDTDDNV